MKTTESIREGLELMKETKDAVLLDVRGEDEYAEGHIGGSVNIPLDRLPKTVPAGELSKDKTYFVYCRSGARSKRACMFLEKSGFEAVNIGGVMDYDGPLER